MTLTLPTSGTIIAENTYLHVRRPLNGYSGYPRNRRVYTRTVALQSPEAVTTDYTRRSSPTGMSQMAYALLHTGHACALRWWGEMKYF